MGNQSAVMKFKNEYESECDVDKKRLNNFSCELSSDVSISSCASRNYNSPLFISMRRKTHSYDRSDEKPKEFFDDINNSIPTVFRWTGKSNKTICVSGSFNNWKAKVPLTKCDDESSYIIISCTPGTHLYKFFMDGNWFHDPNQPVVKNTYGTFDNVIEVKQTDTEAIEAIMTDEDWCFNQNKYSKTSAPDTRRLSPTGDYCQDIPRRTISDYDITPMQFPSYLNESILDAVTQTKQEPSLLPHPHHVQLNHMYASSIKDGLICLSATIRYRTKFITLILYKTIPM